MPKQQEELILLVPCFLGRSTQQSDEIIKIQWILNLSCETRQLIDDTFEFLSINFSQFIEYISHIRDTPHFVSQIYNMVSHPWNNHISSRDLDHVREKKKHF